MDNVDKRSKKNKLDIVDIDKLRAQYEAGLSIRKLSIIHNFSYASLYRALKGRGEKKDSKKKNG